MASKRVEPDARKAEGEGRRAKRAPLDLSSDAVKGAGLTLAGLVLVGLGALVPVPTGGGAEAVAAGFLVLLGFSAILLGVILYLMGTKV